MKLIRIDSTLSGPTWTELIFKTFLREELYITDSFFLNFVFESAQLSKKHFIGADSNLIVNSIVGFVQSNFSREKSFMK